MLSKFQARLGAVHDRLGTAGLVIAIVALVAALAGTAIAAGGLTKQQEKQVKKIAKKYAGKQGPVGPQGPKGDTGAAGAKGDTGAEGKEGKQGTPGTPGTPGAQGKSVEVAPESPGSNCTSGGIGVTVEGSSTTEFVCNGENGETGFTDFLPSGKTETGTWSGIAENPAETGAAGGVAVSFNIPLETAPEAEIVPLVEPFVPGSTANCPGITEGLPTANPGFLCLYEEAVIGGTPSLTNLPATKTGAFVVGKCPAFCLWKGSWAVKAP